MNFLYIYIETFEKNVKLNLTVNYLEGLLI